MKDKIDFVIWTGDSARHDNDERYPRSDKQVIKLNQFAVDKFVEVFGKSDGIDDPDPNDFVIPIVPTFGNNDILPHNIFQPGPNRWTRTYGDMWSRFVPQAQRHTFAAGGWFFSEVIPNKLAVFSLNTLYFFDSNSAVDGCDIKSEPGYEHMEWLRIQLQFLRERGMKAILIGHVPPARTESKQNWDESCYQKYTLWMRQYRDVIITSMFGHMNVDHFMFQDVKDLEYRFKIKGIPDRFARAKEIVPRSSNDSFHIAGKATYLNELRSNWEELPKPPAGHSYLSPKLYNSLAESMQTQKKKKKKPDGDKQLRKFLKAIDGPYGERFSLSLVSPSVVPNYFPTIRIVEYNITGMEEHHPAVRAIGTPAPSNLYEDLEWALVDEVPGKETEFNDEIADELHEMKSTKKHKKKKKKPKKKRPTFPVPEPPSKSSPPGPGYSPQTLSLVSFTQYYANLTQIQEDIESDRKKKHREKHFEYQIEYDTRGDKHYQMPDLTVRSWLDLAERIAREKLSSPKALGPASDDVHLESSDDLQSQKRKQKNRHNALKNHLWKIFVKRAFVHTKPDDEIDQNF